GKLESAHPGAHRTKVERYTRCPKRIISLGRKHLMNRVQMARLMLQHGPTPASTSPERHAPERSAPGMAGDENV
ncbi:MAG: hypothetical protein ACJ8J0_20905, partial [Longimicrobiaceae bacterium]